jgi:hypothetical protein
LPKINTLLLPSRSNSEEENKVLTLAPGGNKAQVDAEPLVRDVSENIETDKVISFRIKITPVGVERRK